MYKSATKCNETLGKWCKNKHGASKIIDTFETYQWRVVDEVNDRPVGNPKRRFDKYSSKFSLSYETKVINPVGKS
jgi:hypothetical protein